MTVITPMVNAALAHNAAMMPAMLAQRVRRFARRGLLSGRGNPVGGSGGLRDYRRKAQIRQNEGQQKHFQSWQRFHCLFISNVIAPNSQIF